MMSMRERRFFHLAGQAMPLIAEHQAECPEAQPKLSEIFTSAGGGARLWGQEIPGWLMGAGCGESLHQGSAWGAFAGWYSPSSHTIRVWVALMRTVQ